PSWRRQWVETLRQRKLRNRTKTSDRLLRQKKQALFASASSQLTIARIIPCQRTHFVNDSSAASKTRISKPYRSMPAHPQRLMPKQKRSSATLFSTPTSPL